MQKKVYIVIVNYNGWKDTIECLESVLKNDYPDYQVIVVDNNSPNNSMAHIIDWTEGEQEVIYDEDSQLKHLSQPFETKPLEYLLYTREDVLKGGDPERETKKKNPLIFIQTGENGGFASANNIGIKYALAKGDSSYLWLLNNDTVVDETSLSVMTKIFERYDKIGIVGSKLIRYHNPDSIQILCGTKRMTWYNAGKGEFILPECQYPENEQLEMVFEIDGGFIAGASMLIHKSVFEDVGYLDEAYFMWAEEADFCMTAIKKGWKLYCCATSKVFHKEGASTGKNTLKEFWGRKSQRPSFQRFIITGYLDIRNHIYFVKKHFGIFWCILFLIGPNLKKIGLRILGILLYDKDKAKRINMLIKGLFDGVFGRMGKPELL